MHLYDSLFSNDNSDQNSACEIINSIHGHQDYNQMSKYHDISSYSQIQSQSDKDIKVLHLDARGLTQKKIYNIEGFLKSLKIILDVICSPSDFKFKCKLRDSILHQKM